MPKSFDAFITYAPGDVVWAKELKFALEGKGLKIWIDSEQVRPGEMRRQAWNRATEDSSSVAILISQSGLESEWAQDEYLRLIDRQNVVPFQLIPVLLRNPKAAGFLGNRAVVEFPDGSLSEERIAHLFFGITGKQLELPQRGKTATESESKLVERIAEEPSILAGGAIPNEAQQNAYRRIWEVLQTVRESGEALWKEASWPNLDAFAQALRNTSREINEKSPYFSTSHYNTLKDLISAFGDYKVGKERLIKLRHSGPSSGSLQDEWWASNFESQIRHNRRHLDEYVRLLDTMRELYHNKFFASEMTDARTEQEVVIVVHGIRTRGAWQKEIAAPLSQRGFIPASIDYGWFSVVPFLIPSCRRRKIDWFRDEYNRVITEYRTVPHLIAHSFGTYIALRALQKFAPTIRFKSVILCGCIVRQDYPWKEIFSQRLVGRVLNDRAELDNWAGTVQHFIGDAGPAGKAGFDYPDISQPNHPEWGHSDFFFVGNFKARWIPFLQGKALSNEEIPSLPPAFGFTLKVGIIMVLFALVLYVVLKSLLAR